MRFALIVEPQMGLTYEEILALAQTAEEAGLEAFFRSDHYASFPSEGAPTTDAWTTVAGLARETKRITLGVLVSPVTFRLPGALAKAVVTVDHMSGGRIELGLGAGWHDGEHAQFGIPFPSLSDRFDMLEEQFAIMRGLWTEPDGWDYEGKHWQIRDASFYPKPVARPGRRHPHLILGGEGRKRSCALAAKYADEYNVIFATPEKSSRVISAVRQACQEHGRDPDELTYSALTGVLVAENEKELRDRQRLQDAELGSAAVGVEAPEDRATGWITGTVDQALERIAALEEAGVQRIVLHDYLPRDLDMIRLIGSRIVGQT